MHGKKFLIFRLIRCCRVLVSLAEILDEIPRLSFAERQELVRRAIALDDSELTAEENALPDARMEDFRRNPDARIPLAALQSHARQALELPRP